MAAVWVIVVAAGSGARFGGPKQYEDLAGRRVLDWALESARAAADRVVLVVPPERAAHPEPTADVVVAGGASRSASVRAGLAAVDAGAEIVVVHDAARPFASPALFAAVVDAVRRGGPGGVAGAVPAVAVTDTVKQVAGGVVVATLDRATLVAVQTPQAFTGSALRAAHATLAEGTDDAGLVEAAGGKVVVVPGTEENRKLTRPEDLDWARATVASSRVRPTPGADR